MSTDDDRIIDAEVVDEPKDPDDSDPSKVTALQRWRPPQYSEEWWAWVSPEIAANRCRAHSSRDGHRCRRPAIAGATVCRAHGGAAKHVKAAARARLDNAALLMAKNLLGLAVAADSDAVRLGATNSALDRTLGKPVQAIAVGAGEQAPYEEIFDSISTTTRAESRAARGLSDDSPQYAMPAKSDAWQPDSPPVPVAQSSRTSKAYEGTDPSTFGRQERSQRSAVRHVTGEDAIEAAARLADERGLPSPHRRYPAP